MKKIVYLIIVMAFSIISVTTVCANPWYVDPDDGDDSWLPPENDPDHPWETIKRALDHCSSNDTIELMDGDFVEAVWDTTWGGSNAWDITERTIQISVDKSNVTLRKYSGNQSKPTIISYDDDYDLNYVMRIDQTYVKVQNIIFDGYNAATSDSVETNDVIYITPDADNTEITNCEFINFGNEWEADGFYAIIAGGWHSETNTLNSIKVNDNEFPGNPFEGSHAHEIYLNYTTNSEIKRNDITNTGVGHPIKFRAGCLNITFESNTVRGAHYCFIGDYPNPGESNSSGIKVTDSSFIDPNSVINTGTYIGPFRNLYSSSFISEFSGNTVVEGGDRNWKVRSITTDGLKLFMCYRNTHATSAVQIHLVEFGEHNGPVFKRIVDVLSNKASGYDCDGNMSYIGNDIFVSTNDGSNIRVYKVNSSTGAIDSTTYFEEPMSDYEITAMCPYNGTYFITALRYYNDANGVWYARIYKSTSSDLLYDDIYSQPDNLVHSVTALGVSGSTLVFVTDEGGGTYKIYSGTIPASGNISTTPRENLSYEVTGLTYLGGTLMTALQDGTSTKIYSGTTSDPVGTLRETYTTTNLIALESDSEFIFMVKDDTGDDDEERTVYFTNSTTNMDDDIIYHSKWYTTNK